MAVIVVVVVVGFVVRLILELIAFSCWLRVGWHGAKSYPFLTCTPWMRDLSEY